MYRCLLVALGFSSSFSLDAVGSSGCTAPACVFSNANLRFGSGSETSVNSWGLFVQPWYYSHTANTWYKLTYSNYPLDTAIGTGHGTVHWSGASIVDLYSLTSSNAVTDYSAFIVDSSDAAKSAGHGKITANRTFTVLGKSMVLQNVFSLGLNDSFVKIITTIINNATTDINNVIMWTGTRDDYVGITDVNTKIRGNLDTGNFTAVTTNSQSSRAIMIKNTNEGVLFYSETQGVMTAYSSCCSFSNVYNTFPLSLAPMTPSPTDGSYAAVLPIGNVSVGNYGSITWYYAAGAVNSLVEVAQSVASAQAVDAGTTISSSLTPTITQTPSQTATQTPSQTPSETQSQSATQTPSQSASQSATQTPSQSASQSATQTVSGTPNPITILLVPGPLMNLTEIIYIETEKSLLYIIGIVPAVGVLICCCCCIGFCLLNNKRREKTITAKLEIRQADPPF